LINSFSAEISKITRLGIIRSYFHLNSLFMVQLAPDGNLLTESSDILNKRDIYL